MTLELKLLKIQQIEEFNRVDGLLVSKPENILYFLGFKIESESLLFVPNREKKQSGNKLLLFLSALEYDQVKHNIENSEDLANNVKLKLIPPGNQGYVANTIKRLKLNRIGFEEEHVSFKRYVEWKEKFKIHRLVEFSNAINTVRATKTPEEVERIKKAAYLADIGFQTIYKNLSSGMTEKEIAAEAEYEMRKKGSEGTSFDTIVATGEKTCYPHASTGEREIKEGDMVLVDIGAKYEGYCSDMSRTFVFGTQDNDKVDLIGIVNEAEQVALDSLEIGIECRQIDKITRDFFSSKRPKWASRFLHSLGHGVGVEIHEKPFLSPISQEILEEGMIFTIEPGLYVPGLGGARTEDLVELKNSGFVSLSQSEKWYS
ncbi:MAG: aminopeptidase P family protein [Candidatus Lokiarchaeota archaeon]|nr:aminopeptidase P family protein [Candidatus Lokiarchaeota archaeon]